MKAGDSKETFQNKQGPMSPSRRHVWITYHFRSLGIIKGWHINIKYHSNFTFNSMLLVI